MNPDGKWEVQIDSPMGKQGFTVDLTSDGDQLTGTVDAGAQEIEPNIIDGGFSENIATWKTKVKKPMPITLTMTMTVEGDTMSGKAKAGAFGTFPANGKRI